MDGLTSEKVEVRGKTIHVLRSGHGEQVENRDRKPANQDVNTFDFPPRLFYFSLVLLAQQLPTGWLR